MNSDLSHIKFMNLSATEFVEYTNSERKKPSRLLKVNDTGTLVLFYSNYCDEWYGRQFYYISITDWLNPKLSILLTSQVSHD